MIDVQIGRTPTGGRSFPLAYKIEFLKLCDDSVERGAKTRLLREHSLTRNTVRRWLDARAAGEFTDSMLATSKKSKNAVDNRDRAELARLRLENDELKRKVAQGEAVQEILGKAYELLEGITTSSTQNQDQIPPALLSADEYAQWLRRHTLS